VRRRENIAFERGMILASPPFDGPIPPIPPYLRPAPVCTVPVKRLTMIGERVPVGVLVPRKPGFVYCPFGRSGLVDIRGYTPGSLVRDPYTGKLFRVP